MKSLDNKKIIFSGGGTLGSVSPLLAIYDDLKLQKNYTFLWIGSRSGPEKEVILKEDIKFIGICSGKLRRYFSFQNFVDVFKIFFGFLESIFIIMKEKPDLVISAGSFVSVPLVWAGWIFRIPILIHQLDFRPGLANKLMAPMAKKISVSFEKSINDYKQKAIWTGSPIRKKFIEKKISVLDTKKKLNLDLNLALIVIVGGGTGSKKINEIIFNIVPDLIKKAEVVHLSGKNKLGEGKFLRKFQNYHQYEFLEPKLMAEYLFSADLIISRAGMGFLSELAFLKKASIIIPMPNSHQEDNAQILFEHKATIVLHEKDINKDILYQKIIDILENQNLRKELGENINKTIRSGEDALTKITKIIKSYV